VTAAKRAAVRRAAVSVARGVAAVVLLTWIAGGEWNNAAAVVLWLLRSGAIVFALVWFVELVTALRWREPAPTRVISTYRGVRVEELEELEADTCECGRWRRSPPTKKGGAS
jgi:hypothetical protein